MSTLNSAINTEIGERNRSFVPGLFKERCYFLSTFWNYRNDNNQQPSVIFNVM